MHTSHHWPSCAKRIPAQLFMCAGHWKQLPPQHRHAIWNAYRPGQEIDKRPSREYLAAARAALKCAADLQRLDEAGRPA